MEWILENIYIVAGIAFFILSALGKMGKGNGESKPSQMPTFGGGDDSNRRGPGSVRTDQPGQQVRRVQSRPGTSAQTGTAQGNRSQDRMDDVRVSELNPYAKAQEMTYESPRDNDSRFDMLSEAGDPREERDSMEMRKRNMQAELEQIHKHLDRMTSHIPETILEVTDTEGNTKKQNSKIAKQALNGVIWSEILGPPRSKRPMGRR
ncbi:hypothetical protein [Paenibacillus sp. GCM10028914]|uniref:hypothetical protein n=1 Tax=Paenibacillus sp. GCM10028914 TaxID=3273416 RepID=UPI003621A463